MKRSTLEYHKNAACKARNHLHAALEHLNGKVRVTVIDAFLKLDRKFDRLKLKLDAVRDEHCGSSDCFADGGWDYFMDPDNRPPSRGL
jgi:hypothetical protein